MAAPSASAPAATAAADAGARPLKSAAAGLRELSPWSMFLSADILVKAVMIGLAFASLLTWTIFIAKMIELSLAQRRLRSAIAGISDAKSLADAQFVLGARDSILSTLLAAAMREARLSAGISSDAGVKERAAPRSCAPRRAGSGSAWDCSRPSARRRRLSGCSAPCGAS
jgi:biopolymer transport protein ExbB